MAELAAALAAVASGRLEPLYLVSGDRTLAEPAAVELGRALAAAGGCEVAVHSRPERLEPILEDLLTYSLFSTGKALVVVESAVLADESGAAELVADALEAPAPAEEVELSPRQRRSAYRLVQALRLFGVEPHAGSVSAALSGLPDWVFRGRGKGRRAPGKAKAQRLRGELEPLLAAARRVGLEGRADSSATALVEIAQRGLPAGHHLVLAESAVAAKHPLPRALAERGALIEAGRVQADRRGGWSGLERLVERLEAETGVGIRSDAAAELARRTLRGGRGGVAAESTGRLAAEYRKLAGLAGAGGIERELVEREVVDRGEEDVWKMLDAVGAGRGGEALARLERLLATGEDAVRTRLSVLALVAGYCRQLTAIGGQLEAGRVRRGERSYPRFKSEIAGTLQEPLGDERPNPLTGLHPYRLHRAYLAASRMPAGRLAALPARALDTELRLKGESAAPEVALAALLAELAALAAAR